MCQTKKIYIVNGMAGCGKDTFADLLFAFTPVFKYSSIDKVKHIAEHCGWDGSKTEKDRQFLSELKRLTTRYNDMSFKAVTDEVAYFHQYCPRVPVMLIDIREPEEIEKAKRAFGAKTILITNKNVRHITSNSSDARVYDYAYDYIIDNSGTLDDFRENIAIFAESEGLRGLRDAKSVL